jgi:FAD/FMN-containing dehydrogenase
MHSFSALEYDAKKDVVTVGSGVLLGDMNNFLEQHGRMLPTGSCPTVGVGGQVLAGGFGGFSRSAGLFLDHLVEMEVVLADGRRETISESSNADLFWVSSG